MTVVQKASLTYPNNPTINLLLFKVEHGVFRWITTNGIPWLDGTDYLDPHDAVKALRVLVETDPLYVGVDLTILPVELPPEERAARRITDRYAKDLYLSTTIVAGVLPDVERNAAIIREETGIDKLVESVNLLLAYSLPRRLQPKPAGLDITWAGLALSVIEAVEVAQRIDLSNLKTELTKGIEKIQVYSTMPPQGGKPQ
jgi:hypothetical protein